ncbi:EamA family transporter [Pseudomonas sp. Marseille-Q5115]|uniref:EamA family transporter n=1 Tax=Pseudomonas sp. Marseille-Q5115 TaxID=2866593 RepID=UPI001CE41EE5|nr:EamA family transporter [Pseudomonas sp. Marseille-Q5115]
MIITYIVALACVVGIAAGQILFKLGAMQLKKTGSVFDPQTFLILIIALGVYGLTTLIWIWILQKLTLGKAYPLMALAFVLVPIASHYFFDERFPPQYFVGVAILITGIIITVRA